jgi:UDP-N-acetylmuramate--alanine ligase
MKIHFIGIDGISMSAIAKIMQEQGHQISGSDLKKSSLTERLIEKGALFFDSQIAKNIEQVDPDIVVYTAAINKQNPELVAAINSRATVYERSKYLGKMSKGYKNSIAIAGSHGKTTTTAMITSVLIKSGVDPTALVGGELADIQGNVRIGQSDVFVTEACEYVESFLSIYPYIGVILNIDLDHLDFFKDINHIISSFSKFSQNIPTDGFLVINSDDEYAWSIIESNKSNTVTFGIDEKANWQAKNCSFYAGGSKSDIYYNGEYIDTLKLIVPGKHNIYNALSVIACCHSLNIDLKKPFEALASFVGTHRRFEKRGAYKGAFLIDDYAHHPKEIKATISAARDSHSPKKLTVIYQPHTYTRTKNLLEDFSKAFSGADRVIITPTYAAREPYDETADSKILTSSILKFQDDVHYVDSYEEAADLIDQSIIPGELIVTMGAGPVDGVIDILLNKTKNQ